MSVPALHSEKDPNILHAKIAKNLLWTKEKVFSSYSKKINSVYNQRPKGKEIEK